MLQLIIKTLARALLIFLPFAYLSFNKDSSVGPSNGAIPESVGLIVLIVFSLILGLIWWARWRTASKRDSAINTTDISYTAKQDH